MGEARVIHYKKIELISQDFGLQWSLGLWSGLKNETSQWTSTFENAVKKKKKERKKEVRMICFLVFVYCDLKEKLEEDT